MIEVSAANKIAKHNATIALIDAGSGAGKIQFFSGSRTAIDATVTAVLVAELLLTKPSGTVGAGGLSLTPNGAGQAVGTGRIDWARVVDSDNSPVFSGVVLASSDPAAASADFIIDDVNVFSGGLINLVSAVLQEGG